MNENHGNESCFRLLATNAPGWCVFEAPNGQIQLDFGMLALVMTRDDFDQFTALLRDALVELVRSAGQVVVLAKQSAARQTLLIHEHAVIAVYFDGTLFCLGEGAFNLLFDLCAEALGAMSASADTPTSSALVSRWVHDWSLN
ncbi:MAG: hypothetical protein KatS3mg053_2699 [Candidatus Roseilinea sp.]|nr:MAG: hypothetical protein KatS3mg053_2699 [Candidatus Roseilinea sp.]